MSALPVNERPLTLPPMAAPEAGSRRSPLRRHWPLAALLAAGAALRITALIAVYPGIWFSDTNNYVREAATLRLSPVRVGGYALLVAPFWHAGSAAALIVTQHVLGLGIVALLYALLVRRGVRPWLAALGVVPAALDAYVIDIEHMIMSETLFHALLVAGIALLLWRERPGIATVAGAGLLLGCAAVVRSVALPLVAVFAVYMLVRGLGARRTAAFVLGWAVVVAGYAGAFDLQHGRFGITEFDGRYLYGQVAPFADCARVHGLPASERRFCPDPRDPLNRNGYVWGPRSPIHDLPLKDDGRIRDFDLRVIRSQPLDYANVVGGSLLHYLEPGHHIGANDYSVTAWQFPSDPRRWTYPSYRGPIRPGRAHRRKRTNPNQYIGRMVSRPHVNVTASRILHDYQRFAYSSGQVLTPCLLIVLAALGLRRGSPRLRLDAALVAAAALTMLLVASALSLFDYRYSLGAVILLPVAAAFAGASLLRPGAG